MISYSSPTQTNRLQKLSQYQLTNGRLLSKPQISPSKHLPHINSTAKKENLRSSIDSFGQGDADDFRRSISLNDSIINKYKNENHLQKIRKAQRDLGIVQQEQIYSNDLSMGRGSMVSEQEQEVAK